MRTFLVCIPLLFSVSNLYAADYRVEALDEPAPADEISSDIAATLSPAGVRVIRGTATTFCDIWLCKQWATQDDFVPTSALLYPFTPGQLMGVVRYSRKGSDYRDQDIESGVYTLRYAQQPVDGSHVGTSLTRDFLLLLRAESDESPKVLDYSALAERSAEAAGSSHPALLSMQRVEGDAKALTMRHDEEHDWWIVGVEGKTPSGKGIFVEFVVYGVAAE
ncbi:MAG: hypothetical protein H6822_14105 [Planctomycetaceae bacterium]|nr:hypothetical protein [Planctomycetales bacterium]MCB9923311.1 hypothetical protein [Planctomycetaceae bacterium]